MSGSSFLHAGGFRFGDVLVVGLVLQLPAEVLDGFVQAFLQRHHRLPAEHHLCFPDVRSSPLWVVLGLWKELDLTSAHDKTFDETSKLQYGVFLRVPQIDWTADVAVHQQHKAIHQIAYILKGSCLGTSTVHSERFSL